MSILIVTYLLNGLLMVALPIGLAILVIRKFGLSWRLFWVGAATFIFSQALHIPFNSLVTPWFNQFQFIALPIVIQNLILAVFLGLSAGVFEELSRYVMFRWWAKQARTWSAGLLAGIGHGGIEAIILGAIVLYGYLQMMLLRGIDISTVVSPDKVEVARSQIAAYWSAPWYMTMLGAVERLFTLPLHMACSLLVMQSFTRRNFGWVGLAILLHTIADGVAVFALKSSVSPVAIEGLIGVIAVICVGIILKTRIPEPEPLPEAEEVTPVRKTEIKGIDESSENLDKTKFQ